VVVGASGSGKSTFARALAEARGLPRLELDAQQHQAGWRPRPAGEMRAAIEAFVDAHDAWVIDGNYSAYQALFWPRADTVVWLDLPRAVVFRSLLWRTARRVATGERLWNGNRETLRDVLSPDPDRSVLVSGWRTWPVRRRFYVERMTDPAQSHLRWLRLCSRDEVTRCLAELGA